MTFRGYGAIIILRMALTTIPHPLADRLGSEGSDALVEVINRAVEDNKKDTIEAVEERFARRLIESESRIRTEMGKDKAELVDRIGVLETKLTAKIHRIELFLVVILAAIFVVNRDALEFVARLFGLVK